MPEKNGKSSRPRGKVQYIQNNVILLGYAMYLQRRITWQKKGLEHPTNAVTIGQRGRGRHPVPYIPHAALSDSANSILHQDHCLELH